MPVGTVVQTARRFSQGRAAITRTPSEIMRLMPSMLTTRRTQLPPAVRLVEQHNSQARTRVRTSGLPPSAL
ncbi:hypothetical protein LINGRAPRIM_LOCUS1469 [Linum grandiflorum]